MPPTPSCEVSLSNQNKQSGVGALSTGRLIRSSLISLKAVSASIVTRLLRLEVAYINLYGCKIASCCRIEVFNVTNSLQRYLEQCLIFHAS